MRRLVVRHTILQIHRAKIHSFHNGFRDLERYKYSLMIDSACVSDRS